MGDGLEGRGGGGGGVINIIFWNHTIQWLTKYFIFIFNKISHNTLQWQAKMKTSMKIKRL